MTRPLVGCLAVGTLAFAGCRGDAPEDVADHFVDLALAGFDQEHALALSDGRARHLLERELRLIGGSRASRSWQDPGNQSSIYYDRGRPKKVRSPGGAERLRFPYVLTIHSADARTERRASVTIERRGETWKVVDYETRDAEEAPQRSQ